MTNSLILAADMKSAAEFARLADLKKHTWRCVLSADSVRGARPTRIYELPSFQRRGNRFGILAAIRTVVRISQPEYVHVTDEELAELRAAAEPVAPEHSDKTVGDQLDIWDALDEPRPEPEAIVAALDAEDAALDKLAEVANDAGVTEAVEAKKAHNAKGKAAVKKVALPKTTPSPTAAKADDFFGV